MSFHVFFAFSTGLTAPMIVPEGTTARIMRHVADVEDALGLKTTQYLDNPKHWVSTTPTVEISDEDYCRIAGEHNHFVRCLYEDLATWSATRPNHCQRFELLTPREAALFWHGLRMIEVPVERWTRDHFRDHMEHLYEVMRGRDDRGVSFGAAALTSKQAEAVLDLFGHLINERFDDDLRLAVPEGMDSLRASYDGGYSWCSHCGAIAEEDIDHKIANCRKRCGGKGCEIRAEYGDND